MPPTEQELENKKLLAEIKEIYYGSRGVFGSRKITAIINSRREKKVNHKRVERIMRENGLFSRTHKKYRITTDSNHDYLIADNLIDRDFETTEPGQKMVSDTTVVETGEGALYAAAILDLYGRMPVGLAMGRHLFCISLAYPYFNLRLKVLDKPSEHSSWSFRSEIKINFVIYFVFPSLIRIFVPRFPACRSDGAGMIY